MNADRVGSDGHQYETCVHELAESEVSPEMRERARRAMLNAHG